MSRMERAINRGSTPEVNLIPFMNLIALLIPVLMISSEYIKISSLAVSTPTAGGDLEDTKDIPSASFKLTVAIGADALHLAMNKDAANTAGTKPQIASIPKTGVRIWSARDEHGQSRELLRIWQHEGRDFIYGTKEVSHEILTNRLIALRSKHPQLTEARSLDYDYPLLQEKLKSLKSEHPEHESLTLTADPHVELENIVRVMDAAREYYSKDGQRKPLFSKVMLGAGIV